MAAPSADEVADAARDLRAIVARMGEARARDLVARMVASADGWAMVTGVRPPSGAPVPDGAGLAALWLHLCDAPAALCRGCGAMLLDRGETLARCRPGWPLCYRCRRRPALAVQPGVRALTSGNSPCDGGAACAEACCKRAMVRGR